MAYHGTFALRYVCSSKSSNNEITRLRSRTGTVQQFDSCQRELSTWPLAASASTWRNQHLELKHVVQRSFEPASWEGVKHSQTRLTWHAHTGTIAAVNRKNTGKHLCSWVAGDRISLLLARTRSLFTHPLPNWSMQNTNSWKLLQAKHLKKT